MSETMKHFMRHCPAFLSLRFHNLGNDKSMSGYNSSQRNGWEEVKKACTSYRLPVETYGVFFSTTKCAFYLTKFNFVFVS